MDNFQKIKAYLPIGGIILLILIFGLLILFMQRIFPAKSSIEGFFKINGTIPGNSTITLLARDVQSQSEFITVANNLNIQQLPTWEYKTAQKGKSYEIKAEIVTGSKILFTSNSLVLTAPSVNAVLVFNTPGTNPTEATISAQLSIKPTVSVSVMPTSVPTLISQLTPTPLATSSAVASSSAQTASMSGTIQFTGQTPLSSRLVVFQKASGSQNYQVAADNLIPYNSLTWIWNGGISGTTYNLISILKQKQTNGTDVDLASSNTLTLTAPSITGAFTINYSTTLSTPAPNISLTCNTINSGNLTFPATISFQTIQGAAAYWFEIGTTDGGTDLTNITQNATKTTNQVLTQSLKNGTTYYAKYAYAAVPNLNVGNSQFSPLSSSVQLKCSQ